MIFPKSPNDFVGAFLWASTSEYICGMYFLFISGAEIFFILFIVVMVFGADKLPEISRGLGKGMRQLRDATDDIKREIQKSAEKQGLDADLTKDIKKEIEGVKKNVEEVAGTIKRGSK